MRISIHIERKIEFKKAQRPTMFVIDDMVILIIMSFDYVAAFACVCLCHATVKAVEKSATMCRVAWRLYSASRCESERPIKCEYFVYEAHFNSN